MATLSLLACQRSFENPSDPSMERYTVKSEAFLKRLGANFPIEGDTVRLFGGLTSQPVEDERLVTRYAWDLNGDGKSDTVLSGTDSLNVVFPDPGMHAIGLTLTDKAGFENSADLSFPVYPNLGHVFELKRYDAACPVYAQEPLFMRLVLALSHFTVEKNRDEGLSSSALALKIAQALSGSAFPLHLFQGLDYTFSRGIYHFRNQGFEFDVALHYGPGVSGHNEGDTIFANLTDFKSYISDFDVDVLDPSITYTKGPLAYLIDGDIQVDLDNPRNPKFDFRVDFNRVRLSFYRQSHMRFVLSNNQITLANALFLTWYDGRARMAPLYPLELIRLYGRDSLALDFSGTKASSPELPLTWTFEKDGKKDSAVYRLALMQETLRQNYRFGNAGGIAKVMGDYAAVNRLGENGDLQSVFFEGAYATTLADSARFYCREPMGAKEYFGTALFETATPNQGDFKADRYGYEFSFPFSTIELDADVGP